MSGAGRWWPAMAGMVAGYWFLGAVGGFAGLGAGWWWARSREKDREARQALPPDLAAAYRTLGVSPRASEEAVKTAYRRLMNRHHPDKLPADTDAATRSQAGDKAGEIRQAYERIRASRASRD